MKVFILLVISVIFLYSSSIEEKEIKIHDVLAQSFFNKKHIKSYIESDTLRKKAQEYSTYLDVSLEQYAKYMILSDERITPADDAVVLVTSYALLKKYKNAVGAFYWKKGRPTIILIPERLEKKNIVLPQKLHKYYENEKCLYELCF